MSTESSHATYNAPKFVCIEIKERNGENVNLRLPYVLVRAGMRLSTLVASKRAADAIARSGIDLSSFSSLPEPEFVQALREGITLTTGKGEEVRVFCE